MPKRSAAWITFRPSSTLTDVPSISRVGIEACSGVRRLHRQTRWRRAPRTGAMAQVLFEFGPELGDETDHRHGRGIGQHADGIAHHVVRDLLQQIDVVWAGAAVLEAGEEVLQPAGPFATRRALAARFVMV